MDKLYGLVQNNEKKLGQLERGEGERGGRERGGGGRDRRGERRGRGQCIHSLSLSL